VLSHLSRLVPGGGTLIRWLLANGLIDEINMFLAPVIIGHGTRLFPERGLDRALELTESKVMANGVGCWNSPDVWESAAECSRNEV